METPEINENCHCVQNDPHRCKIKLEKFHFDILCCYGVIKESLPGGAICPPGEIGLNKSELFGRTIFLFSQTFIGIQRIFRTNYLSRPK